MPPAMNPFRHDIGPSPLSLGLHSGRVVPTLIAGCALVATAHWLGARWVAETIVGIPVGLWLVGAAGCATHFWNRNAPAASLPFGVSEDQGADGTAEAFEAAPEVPPATTSGTTMRIAREPMQTYTTPAKLPRFRSNWRGGIDAGVRTAAAGFVRAFTGANPGSAVARSLASILDQRDASIRPLRVGLMLDDRTASAFMAGSLSKDTQWQIIDGDVEPARACEVHDLDAVVVTDELGELSVRTRENDGMDASWFDWTGDRPLSYAALFPSRVDAARASIGRLGPAELKSDAGELARAVVRTAAVLSRLPHRLTVADRVRGRKPTAAEGSNTLREADRFDVASAVLLDLARELELCGLAGIPASLAAARAAGAFLSTFQGPIDEHERARLMEVCGSAAAQHPDVMLRLGAVRLATFRDGLAFDAFLRADRMLRDQGTLPGVDHLKVIQSELAFGSADGMTLGRVAAGITLACATSPSDRVPFIKEDLLEDMRYSGWLVGKDQDRATLIELLRHLEQARRAETYSLPAAA